MFIGLRVEGIKNLAKLPFIVNYNNNNYDDNKVVNGWETPLTCCTLC